MLEWKYRKFKRYLQKLQIYCSRFTIFKLDDEFGSLSIKIKITTNFPKKTICGFDAVHTLLSIENWFGNCIETDLMVCVSHSHKVPSCHRGGKKNTDGFFFSTSVGGVWYRIQQS